MFIVYDLFMVKYILDCIGVMYWGKLLEVGIFDDVYNNLIYFYMKSLLLVILELDLESEC